MTGTPLDDAFAAMEAAPDDDGPRRAFYETLAGSELLMLLAADPTGDTVSPEVFDTSDGRFALVFDREDRLTAFCNGPAPYAALTGRQTAERLHDQNVGLGLNLGVAPSSHLIPPAAVGWLNETLAARPTEVHSKAAAFAPPATLPATLLKALDTRLARAAGLADRAYLAAVTYADGRKGHLLALIGAPAEAEQALALAVQDALSFSGLDAGEIDVAFIADTDPETERLKRVALRFDLPTVDTGAPPAAPGMDPTKPPRLK